MWFKLAADSLRGVSGYVEVFVLVGVAVAATALAFGAISPYASSLQGASVTLSDASIRQGAYAAFETLTVFNSGGPLDSSLTVTTTGVSGSATYCYTLVNPTSMATLFTNCPSATSNPATVAVAWPLPTGVGLIIEFTIGGGAFGIGSDCLVTVTTSAGGQATAGVQVVPA
jgi:hypothetical protein